MFGKKSDRGAIYHSIVIIFMCVVIVFAVIYYQSSSRAKMHQRLAGLSPLLKDFRRETLPTRVWTHILKLQCANQRRHKEKLRKEM